MGILSEAPRPGYRVLPCPTNLIPRYVTKKQEVLWIGCSDSGFEETTMLDIPLEQTIVLRDIGNMALPEEAASASMIQYALEVLKVKHIVICGHYECEIVKAACKRGLKGPWFEKLDQLRSISNPALQAVDSEHRDGRFVELNVVEQMKDVVHKFPEVQRAVEERGLQIHGLVYSRTWNKAVQILPDGQADDWLHR